MTLVMARASARTMALAVARAVVLPMFKVSPTFSCRASDLALELALELALVLLLCMRRGNKPVTAHLSCILDVLVQV